jgi:hypothetical protein
MDLSKSQWANWLPESAITDTPRKFYSKYYYRAEFVISGAYFMRYIKLSEPFELFESYVIKQQEKDKKSPWKDAWGGALVKDRAQANAAWLYDLHHACLKHKGHIRTRIEGNRFRVFTTTKDDLLDIFAQCPIAVKSCLRTISQPASLTAIEKLDDNVIYLKSEPKYKYRVTVREGKYDPAVKQQIVNYCDNFIDDIYLTTGFREMLTRNNRMWVSGYFHVNDLESLTFLALISPRFVNKIYKLEQA